jgi:hypothetical protein
MVEQHASFDNDLAKVLGLGALKNGARWVLESWDRANMDNFSGDI